MVTFQCQACSQRITVIDGMSNSAVTCPRCRRRLVVPARTPVELAAHALPIVRAAAAQARSRSRDWEEWLYADVTPDLARRMMKRLVEGLLGQRRQLLATQEAGTEKLTALEARMAQLQQRHRERVAELTLALAARDAEIARLRRQKAALLRELETRVALEALPRVELRDAGLLLRA